MRFRVELTVSAEKNLFALPVDVQGRLIEHLQRLGDQWPVTRLDVKRLQGVQRTFRLRVGRYRAIFAVDGHVLVVTRIGERGNVYR